MTLGIHMALGGNRSHRHENINPDLGCYRFTDPDMALSSSPGQDAWPQVTDQTWAITWPSVVTGTTDIY